MPTSLSGFPQQLLSLTVTSSTQQQQTPNAHHEYVLSLFIHSPPLILPCSPKLKKKSPTPPSPMVCHWSLFSPPALYLIVHAIGLDIVEPAKDDPAEEGGEDSESLFGGTSSSLALSFPALYLIVPAIHR